MQETSSAKASAFAKATQARIAQLKERIGQERFKQSLLRHARQSASAILESVIRDVFDFRSSAPQQDDLTLVVLKRIP